VKAAVLEREGSRIVEWVGAIDRVDDALDLVSACFENNSRRLLLDSSHLPAAFFDLRTRFAGEFLQKFENYQIRLAGLFAADHAYGERFSEFLSEARRGRSFRAFFARADAEAWLASE
jgi:hypothetical protein